ncbi:protein CEPU-1-like isoform X2 [Frieseomelitta varia]|uniref:protein CEPU-1-like isoform X2 n=1 Tax=Frieseomelitta varia TaxID=561572 RepID=UPI001CB67FDF|nr:protein CEPU-1-like isoform X2 [Frieseomelitta varia]
MCQINTDPMKSQTGMLSIVVPPDFIPEETSSDVMVREGGQVKLTCRARGVPPPSISWRREDGKNIIIRKPFAGTALNQKSHVTSVSEYHGEELKLTKISRNEMGVYLCIAINGVPPAVSKRISINVHSMIISSQQHDVQMIEKSKFEVRMVLTIRNLQKDNVGTYKCVAKNSLGDVESSIRLYEISGPTKTQTAARPPFYDEEDETVYGSAEKMDNKPLSVDNTINGHAGYPSVATPVPTTRIGKKRPISIQANSNANRHRRASDLLIVLMLIVAQSQGRQ